MLKQVAKGVLVNESEFIQSNAVIVEGRTGVLLIDPGITVPELSALAGELEGTVVAGFSTHHDWDHVLWHADLGDAPRYATAETASYLRELLATADWRQRVAEGLPPEHAADIPMELLGVVTGLSVGAAEVPWDGPRVRIIEHRGHAAGHAALLIEDARVLVAGDMLSDILIPFLDLDAADPLNDYLAALDTFDSLVDQVDVVIPGHGSVGDREQLRARIAQDRSYVEALRDGVDYSDPRADPVGEFYWLAGVHDWQVQRLGTTSEGN
ncbi:MBL fold metallo-hydrolase [soil metagenome]